jgi:hypothetical protein
VLRRYSSSLWIRCPLARRTRCQVLVSSSGMVPSQRYSEIDLLQSASGLSGLTIVAISPPGSRACLIGPAEVVGSALEVRATPSLSGRVPDMGVGLSSPGEIPGVGVRISFSSRMESLNKSYMNTPEEAIRGSIRAHTRVLAASLSHQRIWRCSKPSNFSSNFLTSCWYAVMQESRQFDSPMAWLTMS